MMSTPSEIARIVSYHAHIYYRSAEERDRAAAVRAQIAAGFSMKMGRWRDLPVGPHAAPMFQVAFDPTIFPTLVPWLMLNRQGLVILLHPNTGAPRGDHLVRAFWFGEVLPIVNVAQLPERSDEDETVIPDPPPHPPG